MTLRMMAITAIVLMFIGGAAVLTYSYIRDRNELKEGFCSALNDPAVYEENKLESFSVLIPGRGGAVFRTKYDFRTDWSVSDKTVDHLLSLQNAFRAHNAELVIVTPPVRGMALSGLMLAKYRKQNGIDNPDEVWKSYLQSFNELRDKGVNVVNMDRTEVGSGFFYKRDHHWSAEGARIAAESVAERVKELPVYDKVSRQEFVTNANGKQSYDSAFGKAFKTICQTALPPEQVTEYVTVPANAAKAQDDLFGEKPMPQIVLLGTSNSVSEASMANFEGFLKEHLSADVLNYSKVGGGVDDAIMQYVQSDHFAAKAPKIVIWEIPGHYDLDVMDDKLFNQIIPATERYCRAPSYEKRMSIVGGGKMVLFDFDKERPASWRPAGYGADAPDTLEPAEGKYLKISFSVPPQQNFTAEFQYENGAMKKQSFEPAARNSGKDFYTLVPDYHAKLERINLALPWDQKAGLRGLSAQVCSLRAGREQMHH